MIVGATNAIITKAPLTDRTAPASHSTGDEPSDALNRLGNLTESAAHSRKAFAEERLKQLREQMSKLMLFDLAPRALAGQSAQFARELRAAAELPPRGDAASRPATAPRLGIATSSVLPSAAWSVTRRPPASWAASAAATPIVRATPTAPFRARRAAAS